MSETDEMLQKVIAASERGFEEWTDQDGTRELLALLRARIFLAVRNRAVADELVTAALKLAMVAYAAGRVDNLEHCLRPRSPLMPTQTDTTPGFKEPWNERLSWKDRPMPEPHEYKRLLAVNVELRAVNVELLVACRRAISHLRDLDFYTGVRIEVAANLDDAIANAEKQEIPNAPET